MTLTTANIHDNEDGSLNFSGLSKRDARALRAKVTGISKRQYCGRIIKTETAAWEDEAKTKPTHVKKLHATKGWRINRV